MANRDLVVIGASAGGFDALQTLCKNLPADLNAAVLVVTHLSAQSDGMLPRILTKVGNLPAHNPQDGETILNGNIYVAPPDFHMIVEDGKLRVIRGPRENRHRPAIDPTFRSAATHYGRRVIGVVLTGMLDDGTSGLMVVRARGGKTIVQDPATALFPSMPQSALERVPDAEIANLENIPELLVRLVSEELGPALKPVRRQSTVEDWENRMSELNMADVSTQDRPGSPSPFGCPECGGVLWEIDQAGLLRYRCRVGHAYTARHLRAEQRQAVEAALWSALRALEESASLYRRMVDKAKSKNFGHQMGAFEERAKTAEGNAETLRNFLVTLNAPDAEIDESPVPQINDLEHSENDAPQGRTGT